MGFVYMTNEATGGTTDVADEADVIAHFEARGWKVEERPEPAPFVPSPGAPDAVPPGEFVTLYHPGVDATHEFPNNPEAIEGAHEAGWQYPTEAKPEDATPEEPPAAKPVRKPRKSTNDGPAVEETEE